MYCSVCQSEIKDVCKNLQCSQFNRSSISRDYFHYISIKDQLAETIKCYYDQILDKKLNDKNYYDITNSNFYKKLNNENKYLNLMIYSDGVNLNNTNKHFWPVFLSICELPLGLRDSRHNKIIAGKYLKSLFYDDMK